ncbi:PAS domain S-box protein [candidate division KSB1 bacterium]|nr:PAS domain S-box protein [candidate division KSB1 bacterium]
MHNARVLVVEDESIVAKDIEIRLKKAGYDVVGIASHGDEAIEMAIQFMPDIILMDIKLIGAIDGIKAAQTIREKTGLPVIYLTALADEQTIQRAKLTEPFGYIIKPFRMGELVTAIEMGLYRHKMEKKIIENEAKYRVLVESMSEGLIICDPKGHITFVNPTFCTMIGHSADDVISRNMLDLIDEDSKNIMKNQWILRKQGVNDPYEIVFKRKNGNSLFARISPRGLFSDSHEYTGSFGLVTDITQQKSTEKLANIRRGLSQALSATSDLNVAMALCIEAILLATSMEIGGIYLSDTNNGEFRLVCSKGFSDTLNERARRFLSDSTFTRLVGNGKTIWSTFNAYGERLFGPDMEELYRALVLVPVFFKDTIIASVLLISKNQTEISEFSRSAVDVITSQMGDVIARLQTEEALQVSEGLYRTMIDSLDDIIHIIDRDFTVTLFNKTMIKWARQDGYHGDFFQKNLFDIFTFLPNNVKQEYLHVFESGKTLITEETTQLNGKEITTETRKIPLFEGKKVKLVITVVRDISARKKAEGYIRILTQELLKLQENERQRIARDLHDHIAQDMLSVKINFEMLCENQEFVKEADKNKVHQISESLQSTINAVRDISYYLGPLGLDQLGLVRTLVNYLSDFGEKNNIKVDFSATGMERLKLEFETQINLYRIVQEALNNVKKHAKAKNVKVRLIYSHPKIILKIEDDGTGFDVENRITEAIRQKRMGLRSMEERAGILGGTFNITGKNQKGTRIIVEIPKRELQNEF